MLRIQMIFLRTFLPWRAQTAFLGILSRRHRFGFLNSLGSTFGKN